SICNAISAGCISTYPAASMPAAITISAISAFSASRSRARNSIRSRSAARPTRTPSSARCSARPCHTKKLPTSSRISSRPISSCAHGLTKSLSTRWPASASSLSRNACMRFVRDGKPAEDNFQLVADDVPIPENVAVLLSATRFLAEASALAGRPASAEASARKRVALSRTATFSGIGTSSATSWKLSSAGLPSLTNRIHAFLERLDADAGHRVDKDFVRPCAQLDIGRDDILDDVGNFFVWHGRAEQRAELGVLVGLAAERDLIEFLALLLDADMADMVMAAGIDAAGYVDMQPADIALQIEVGKTTRDFHRHRNRARVGEAAIIEARARDDVGDEVDVRDREAGGVELLP